MKYIRCFNCDKPIYTDEEIKIGIVVECPHCGEKYECIDWNGFINRWVRLDDEIPKENTEDKDKELKEKIEQKIAEYNEINKNSSWDHLRKGIENLDKINKSKTDEDIENEIHECIRKMLGLFDTLEQTHPSDTNDFRQGIHELQKVIGMRRLRRLMPEVYPSYRKENGEWKMV